MRLLLLTMSVLPAVGSLAAMPPWEFEQRLEKLEALMAEQLRINYRLEAEREDLAARVGMQDVLIEKIVAACDCGSDGSNPNTYPRDGPERERLMTSTVAVTRIDKSTVSTNSMNAKFISTADLNVTGTLYMNNIFINGLRWSPLEPSSAPSLMPSSNPTFRPSPQPTAAPVGTYYGTCSGAYGTYNIGSPYPFQRADNINDIGWIGVTGCFWGISYDRPVHVNGVQLWSVYQGGARGCQISLAYSPDGGSSFTNLATFAYTTTNGGASQGAVNFAGRYDYSTGGDPIIKSTNWRVTVAAITGGHCPSTGTAQLVIQ